jgi:hypothetical protein
LKEKVKRMKKTMINVGFAAAIFVSSVVERINAQDLEAKANEPRLALAPYQANHTYNYGLTEKGVLDKKNSELSLKEGHVAVYKSISILDPRTKQLRTIPLTPEIIRRAALGFDGGEYPLYVAANRRIYDENGKIFVDRYGRTDNVAVFNSGTSLNFVRTPNAKSLDAYPDAVGFVGASKVEYPNLSRDNVALEEGARILSWGRAVLELEERQKQDIAVDSKLKDSEDKLLRGRGFADYSPKRYHSHIVHGGLN